MQTAAIDAPALSVSMNKGKLIIRGPALARHSEFLQTLPSSRWNELLGAWTCEATPSAAWRLACLEGSRGCQHTTFLSAQFAAAIASSDSDSQPPLRRFDAWQHQRKGYHFAAPKPAALLAMGMGTGKSKLATDLICNDSDAKSVLILCPSSVLGVWRRELETHAGRPIESLILDKGTTKKKAEVADDFLIRHAAWGKRSIAAVVANYESAWREVLAKWQLSRGWDWVICDESHRIKSHDSASSKHCAALGKVSARRLCLTGTPLPHSPLDAFGQFRFLDRGIFGTWFTHFRSRYARMSPIFPGQVDEWQNQEELTERMGLLTYRCKAEDVLDLPPVTHHSREVELGSKALKAYRDLENELVAEVEGGTITAANGLAKLLRLQQLTSGYAGLTDGQTIEVDTAKRSALTELLEDIGDEPVAVFCRFRCDLSNVRLAAERLGRRYGEVSGSSRSGVNDRGQMAEGVKVCGVQIQAGGLGIDLTAAAYGVYYSLGYSLGDYDQSLARIHRPGQLRPVHYYHLIATGTVDQKVCAALRERREVVEYVLSNLKG